MKKVKITTIILAIILITLVAFGGVYIKTQNRMENKVAEYQLGRELSGGRVIELKVVKEENKSTETTEGENAENTEKKDENIVTVEDYETVKATIEERLNQLGAQDYAISLNDEDGTILVELPEDANTDIYVYFLTASGKVQIKEKDAGTELLSDNMVKKALYTYTSDMEGAYQVYLELHLTEDGQAKVNEIQNNYAIFESEIEEIEAAEAAKKEENKETEGESTTEETPSETETETIEETKKIAVLTIGGSQYSIDKIEKNKVRVKIGSSTTNSTSINNNISMAAEWAILINSGKYPVEYEINDNRFIYPDITENQLLYVAISVMVVLLISFVVLIIKYKSNGFFASVSFIGFASILSLILRYTNVIITVEGIGAIIVTFILNIIVNKEILSKAKEGKKIKEAILESYKDTFLKLIPVIIITLVFCFSGWTNLNSFGMIMFWGLVLIAAYNAVVTSNLLKLKESK